MNNSSSGNLGSISSSDLIDAKLEEHQICGSKQCPSCGHKLDGKPVTSSSSCFSHLYFFFGRGKCEIKKTITRVLAALIMKLLVIVILGPR